MEFSELAARAKCRRVDRQLRLRMMLDQPQDVRQARLTDAVPGSRQSACCASPGRRDSTLLLAGADIGGRNEVQQGAPLPRRTSTTCSGPCARTSLSCTTDTRKSKAGCTPPAPPSGRRNTAGNCFIQYPFDSHTYLRSLGHRHGFPNHSPLAALHGRSHIQKRLRVRLARSHFEQRGIVAGLLGKCRQPAFQPPCQRVGRREKTAVPRPPASDSQSARRTCGVTPCGRTAARILPGSHWRQPAGNRILGRSHPTVNGTEIQVDSQISSGPSSVRLLPFTQAWQVRRSNRRLVAGED